MKLTLQDLYDRYACEDGIDAFYRHCSNGAVEFDLPMVKFVSENYPHFLRWLAYSFGTKGELRALSVFRRKIEQANKAQYERLMEAYSKNLLERKVRLLELLQTTATSGNYY